MKVFLSEQGRVKKIYSIKCPPGGDWHAGNSANPNNGSSPKPVFHTAKRPRNVRRKLECTHWTPKANQSFWNVDFEARLPWAGGLWLGSRLDKQPPPVVSWARGSHGKKKLHIGVRSLAVADLGDEQKLTTIFWWILKKSIGAVISYGCHASCRFFWDVTPSFTHTAWETPKIPRDEILVPLLFSPNNPWLSTLWCRSFNFMAYDPPPEIGILKPLHLKNMVFESSLLVGSGAAFCSTCLWERFLFLPMRRGRDPSNFTKQTEEACFCNFLGQASEMSPKGNRVFFYETSNSYRRNFKHKHSKVVVRNIVFLKFFVRILS